MVTGSFALCTEPSHVDATPRTPSTDSMQDPAHTRAAIMLNLVFHAKDAMQRELLAELYKPDMIEDMLKESDSVVQRRKECIKMVRFVASPLEAGDLRAVRRSTDSCSVDFLRQVAALNKAESIVASVA